MELKIDFWKPGRRGSQSIELLHEKPRDHFYYRLGIQGNNRDLNSVNIKKYSLLRNGFWSGEVFPYL